MKIRNGFVSNSSSSSFIIAIKKVNVACPHCGRKDLDFLDMVDRSNNYIEDNKVYTKTTEDTLNSIEQTKKEWICEEEYKNLEKELLKRKDNKDWFVAEINLSYHDTGLREIMHNMVVSGNAEILWESEG